MKFLMAQLVQEAYRDLLERIAQDCNPDCSAFVEEEVLGLLEEE